MKRVLIYSHDTFGLGNIRRMLEVARHLVQSSPEVSVLVITGSPMLHAFRIPEGIDYIKLPCLSRGVDGKYGARSLPMTLEATVRLRANLIRSAITDFAPDLILVDKKPFGVEDELAGALEGLPSAEVRPKLVLLLRDILDSAESTTRIWRKNGYFDQHVVEDEELGYVAFDEGDYGAMPAHRRPRRAAHRAANPCSAGRNPTTRACNLPT